MKYLVLSLLVSYSSLAPAQFLDGGFYNYSNHEYITPSEGMWHVEEEPGRGVTIENQDGRLLLTFFGYAQNGDNQWWQGVGVPQNGAYSNTYQGELSSGRNGQCAGCDYAFPELDEAASLGSFILSFSDGNNALMTWQGKDLNLQKYYYGYTSTLDRLRGFWLFKSFNLFGMPTGTGYTLFDKKQAVNGRDVLINESISYEGTFKAATTFINDLGEDIVVVGEGISDVVYGHQYTFYAFRLDHSIGRGGFDNDPDTGRYFYGDTMTKDPVESIPYGPFYAYRIMDAHQAEPFYHWYTQVNSMPYYQKTEKLKYFNKGQNNSPFVSKTGFTPQPLSEGLLSSMDFLVSVLSQSQLP